MISVKKIILSRRPSLMMVECRGSPTPACFVCWIHTQASALRWYTCMTALLQVHETLWSLLLRNCRDIWTSRISENQQTFVVCTLVRDKTAGTIAVHQMPYIQALVSKYKPEKLQVLPMDPRTPLVASGPGYDDVAGYSTIMGELQHLVNCTRPDIARALSALS